MIENIWDIKNSWSGTRIRCNWPVLGKETILTTGAKFQINNVKLSVPVVTFSINDNIEFLEHLKKGFEGIVS